MLDGLSGPAKKDAFEKLARLCYTRSLGIDSEEELVEKSHFDSAAAMRVNLHNWGLSALLPLEESPAKQRRERKPQHVEDEKQELPPFANAATHLRDTIQCLESPYLEQMLDQKEYLQGSYFVSEGGADEPNTRELRGAQWHPHPYEVVLIAASVLRNDGNWGHVERLLNELHPNPAEANRQQLVRFIYGQKVDAAGRPVANKSGVPTDYGDGLLDRANHVAALIRGKPKVSTGAKHPHVSSSDHLRAVWARSLMDRSGYSWKQVVEAFREDWELYRDARLRSLREERALASDQVELDELDSELALLEEEEFSGGDFEHIRKLAEGLH